MMKRRHAPGEEAMKAIALVLGLFLITTSAKAETISACVAQNYAGQRVTVEGYVDYVDDIAAGKMTILNICGHYPKYGLKVVLFSRDTWKIPDADSLRDKTVDVTGTVELHEGRPEIDVTDPAQLGIK
jgi:hypothetical protein